jgi:hypothetical protein
MGVRREERMQMSLGDFWRMLERPLRIGPDILRGWWEVCEVGIGIEGQSVLFRGIQYLRRERGYLNSTDFTLK